MVPEGLEVSERKSIMTRDLPACTWRAVEQICCHHVSYHFTVFNLKTYFFDCLQRTANVGSSQVFQCEDSSTRRQSAMLSSGVLRLPRCRWIRHMRSWNQTMQPLFAGILQMNDSRAICPKLTQAFCIVLFFQFWTREYASAVTPHTDAIS